MTARTNSKVVAEGACRLCRRSSRVRALTRHRLFPGCLGGSYESHNVVPLCRPCHDLVDHRRAAERLSARRMLRASLWPVEVARARARFGPEEFDRKYPPPPRELVLERRSAVRAAA